MQLWERRKTEYLNKEKRSIVSCLRAYRTEFSKFLKEAKPYESIINSVCVELKKKFETFFDEELQKQTSKFRTLLAKTNIVAREESTKAGEELVEVCEELFESIKETSEEK